MLKNASIHSLDRIDRPGIRALGTGEPPFQHLPVHFPASLNTQRRRPPEGLVFYYDRGVQDVSGDFGASLQNARLVPSMSRKGNCWDNAAMEAFWSTLKHEFFCRTDFLTRDEARMEIFDYITRFYNTRRLHSSIGYLSPVNIEGIL